MTAVPAALWLVPAAPSHRRFRTIIRELADQFGSIVFEPHITLMVGTLRTPTQAGSRLAAVAAAEPSIELRCQNTLHGSEHFKTLFVTFHDARIVALRDSLVAAIDLRGGYELHPHLSLLYRGNLDVRTREQLAATHRFDGERVIFDTVALVHPAPGSDLSDIAGLDTRERHRLSGPI